MSTPERKEADVTGVPYPIRRTPEGERVHAERRVRRTARRLHGRSIVVKFAAECDSCGREMNPGDNAWWARGAGMTHPECAEAELEQYKATTGVGRTDAEANADHRRWRNGAIGSYRDYIEGAAEDALLREEYGQGDVG